MAGDTDTDVAGMPKADIQVKVTSDLTKPSEDANTQPLTTTHTAATGNHVLALVLLIAGILIIVGTGAWLAWYPKPGYTGGGSAASAGVLFVLALLVDRPTLIMDDEPDAGGEPSTMRILTLIIVLTFAVLTLRTGWNTGTLPTLENQGNWIWLVTAALGGKALQKFAEVQDKKK